MLLELLEDDDVVPLDELELLDEELLLDDEVLVPQLFTTPPEPPF